MSSNNARGRYLDSHFFFGEGSALRGGFVLYSRRAADGEKTCLLVEARRSGTDSILRFEIDERRVAEFVAVLRGQRASFEHTVGGRGQDSKQLAIFYNHDSTPPNAWVLTARQAQTHITIAFDSATAWLGQYYAIRAMTISYGGVSDVLLWQMLAATGRAAP